MVDQFRRAYSLQVGEVDPLGLSDGFGILSSSTEDSLRIAFEIERDETPWPNRAEIQIWNLNPTHRDFCAAGQAIRCKLEAGYPGGLGILFDGYLRTGETVRDGRDWVTTLQAGDGEVNRKGEPLASGQIQKAWKAGTPLAVVVTDFAKELDVDLGNVAALAGLSSTRAGPALVSCYAVDGPILDEWVGLMRSLGLTWSIQDGALQLRVPDAPAGIAPVVSPFTGLVGGVVKSVKQIKRKNVLTKADSLQTINVVQGSCLLLPGLNPGLQFLLQSEASTGAYLCHAVRHSGDTHGQDWYTEFEGWE